MGWSEDKWVAGGPEVWLLGRIFLACRWWRLMWLQHGMCRWVFGVFAWLVEMNSWVDFSWSDKHVDKLSLIPISHHFKLLSATLI